MAKTRTFEVTMQVVAPAKHNEARVEELVTKLIDGEAQGNGADYDLDITGITAREV